MVLCSHLCVLFAQAHVAKLAKESVERNRGEDVRVLSQRSEQREEELNLLIEQLENKHGTRTKPDKNTRTNNYRKGYYRVQ